MINIHYMKKNYNWAKVTLVMGCMLGLGWLATPVMARDMDVRLMDEDTTIMVVAEVQPEFNGNLNQWIGENVRYPEDAYANQIDGRVFVTFVIEKDGAVTHARVVRSAHPLLDAEALRVIAGMPKWKPAMLGGKAVRFEKTLPITFKYTPQETVLTFEEYLKNLEEERVMLEKGEKMSMEDMARRVNAFKEQLGDDATLRKMLLEKSQSIKGQIDSTVKVQTKVLKLKKNDVKELTKIYEDEIDAKIKLIESLGTDQFISYFVESELEMRKIEMDKMLKIKDLLKDRFKLYFENYILQQ
ncbi:energy transducer TonB [Butyricimonas virosa]|uniref:Energy transducer TonB n=2 Tax=Butyricimonas virosa TaxID=544645 RepID=A0A413ILI3_9BACT|nr:energy transducer TonB [Butyricimonas virosa]RHI23559.1 energy transducer TonB [Butyricimonas virosa]